MSVKIISYANYIAFLLSIHPHLVLPSSGFVLISDCSDIRDRLVGAGARDGAADVAGRAARGGVVGGAAPARRRARRRIRRRAGCRGADAAECCAAAAARPGPVVRLCLFYCSPLVSVPIIFFRALLLSSPYRLYCHFLPNDSYLSRPRV